MRLRHGAKAKEGLGPDVIGLLEITLMEKSLGEQRGAFIFLMYHGYENDKTSGIWLHGDMNYLLDLNHYIKE